MFNKKLLLTALLVFVSCVAIEGTGCAAKDEPPPMEAETDAPDFTLDFNDIPLELNTWFSSPYNVTFGSMTVTIYGPECKITGFYFFGSGDNSWDGTKLWSGGDTTPGKFVGLGNNVGAFCEFTFSEPISAFSIRVRSHIQGEAGVFIYDDADQEINCRLFPTTAGQNTYSVRGFNTSTTNNIKKIVVKDTYSAADLILGTFCSGGKKLLHGICQIPTPCNTEPYPCGSNANCTISGDQAVCTCFDYYEGDATVGCNPITCASSDAVCSEHATCADLEAEPFVDCTCNEGFEGSGFGPGGCIAVAEPSSSPSSGTPSGGSGPSGTTPNSATPDKKVSAGSMVGTSISVVVASVCYLLVLSM